MKIVVLSVAVLLLWGCGGEGPGESAEPYPLLIHW